MSGILSTPKVFALIQARTGSTRIPGKILKEIPEGSGITLLEILYSNIRKVFPEERIYFLVPASDFVLINFLESKSFRWISGPEEDVWERYRIASETLSADWIVRLTADNPFIDTQHLDLLVQSTLLSSTELALTYISGLALGMGGEMFSTKAMTSPPSSGVWEDRHREHVSLHIKEEPSGFCIRSIPSLFSQEEKQKMANMRLTVDEPKDLELVREIQSRLGTDTSLSAGDAILDLYAKEPELFSRNQSVSQIRFSTPKREMPDYGSICILYGNDKKMGSGHWERMKYLYGVLSLEGYRTQIKDTIQHEKADLLIVDHRDLPIELPWKNQFKNLLLLDHFGKDRDSFPHFDLLPNTSSICNFRPDHLLIPRFLTKSPTTKKGILIYAGSLDKRQTEILDRKVREAFPNAELSRIGGQSSENTEVQTVSRLSRLSYYEIISSSFAFVTYFGQSAFEALFLGTPVFLFGMSSDHENLGKLMDSEYGIPYLGNLTEDWKADVEYGRTALNNFRRSLHLQASGYANLFLKIQRIFRAMSDSQ